VRPRLLLTAAALPLGLLAPIPAHAAPIAVKPVVETVALDAANPAATKEVRNKHFAMVAVRWSGPDAPVNVQLQAQRVGGTWGPWLDVEEQDGPDTGRTKASEPVWVGDSTAVRVRSDSGTAGLSAVLIDPGTSPADAAPKRTALPQATPDAVAQPSVISRASWGADETIRTDCFARQGIGVEYAGTVKAATIHHTAGTNDYTAADSARIVRGIYAFHAIDNDWCDIGYNVLVDKYGQVFEGRFGGLDKPVLGAHAGGFNTFTSGVSMLGTFTDVAPSPEQLEAVAQIVAWKLAGSYRDPNGQVTLISAGGGTSKYPAGTPVTLPVIFGHRDTGNTECPGDVGYTYLPSIRTRVTAIMGSWTSSPVYAKWLALGGEAGAFGGVFNLEHAAANGGLWTGFHNGEWTIYWSSGTAAHMVIGGIRAKWDEYSRETGFLGYPISDELGTPDGVGRYNNFAGAGGSIYWTPSTGGHEIHGGIKAKWLSLNAERGPLAYPATDELITVDGVGRYNRFSGANGVIYWTPSTGAHEVHGGIQLRWAALGAERSYLGYPISDEYSITGGRRSDFQGGYITWNASTGVVTDHRY
jgi:uncharacterized protein with LGFP repeats